MGFVKKFEIFPSFYLRQNKPGKCVSTYSTILFYDILSFHDILERKNACLDYKKKKLKKNKKIRSSTKGIAHGFCQIFEILHLSIPDKTGQNNTFHDILKGKNVYLDNKNKKLKTVQKLEFFQRG